MVLEEIQISLIVLKRKHRCPLTFPFQVMFFKSMFERGVLFINALLNSSGEIMSYDDIEVVYGNICDIYTYNQLCAAIPQTWKRNLLIHVKQMVCCIYIGDTSVIYTV